MIKKLTWFILFLSLGISLSMAHPVFAHEVYVLDNATIARDIANSSPNPFSDVPQETYQFILWGLISIIIVSTVLLISITKKIEVALDPFLFRIKHFAPVVTRVTLGLCLIASAYYGGMFGPELPLASFIGESLLPLVKILMYTLGILIILGIFVRVCAAIALLLFMATVWHYGAYMLTYANYLGEMLITLILGAGQFSVTHYMRKGKESNLFKGLERYSFFILRVLFGTAVIFASFYAKFLHSNLAIDTVTQYHLTNYFPFVPLFIVLGAFIVEFLIGLFFIIGFEVRFTALVFLTFLGLSLSYFGEAVWPHIILIGVNVALFLHGYDDFTIENKIFRSKKLEPTL